jgi:hypothetical protein
MEASGSHLSVVRPGYSKLPLPFDAEQPRLNAD